MPKRVLILAALLCGAMAALAASPQVVVDRPRLDQKLRRASEALSAARERSPKDDRVLRELLEEARTQLEQARAQLAAERSADAWLEQKLEAEQGTKPPDAGGPPMWGKDAYDTDVAVEQRAAPPPRPLPPGKEPLGEVGMRLLINAMRGQEFRGGKMRVLAQAAPAYVFTVAQIIEVLGELRAPADRQEALQLMVPHLADKENVPILYRACISETERNLVQRLLGS